MGAVTLLIKVKAHRGDPLNEEADIRVELVCLMEYKQMIWDDSTDELYTNGLSTPPNTKGPKFSKLVFGLMQFGIISDRKSEK